MQFMCMLTQFKRTLDKSKQWVREFDRISDPTATAKVIGVRGRARGLELAPAGEAPWLLVERREAAAA